MINYIYIIHRKADVCIPVSRSIWKIYGIIQSMIFDHIYPQSKTMDDSLKNRVLVKKNTMPKIRYLSDRSRHSKKMMPFLEIPFDRRIYSKRKIMTAWFGIILWMPMNWQDLLSVRSLKRDRVQKLLLKF